MSNRGVAIALAAVFALASPAASPSASGSGLRADLDRYFVELERIHPDPYHSTPETEMRAAADRLVATADSLGADGVLVGLMRLVAMLGERDGHAVLHPLGSHRRVLHAYPLWPYRFSDGVYVVATGGPGLVGARLAAVEGMPIEDVLSRLEPLMTRDNEQTLKTRASLYLVSAEVLHGLGITPTAERATFTFELPTGARTDLTLAPLPVAAYQRRLKRTYPHYLYGLPQQPKLLFLRHKNAAYWATTIDRGRVVYFSYNRVVEPTYAFTRRLRKLVRGAKVRRVIVDLRNNGGGDIGTYPPLLDIVRSKRLNARNRLVLLIGRLTFSAAVHFTADVQSSTRAVLVGEPTGGAPNHWSDTDPVALEGVGLTIDLPTIYFEKRPGERGLTIEPDHHVDLTGADYFAGRDPVLAAALQLPR